MHLPVDKLRKGKKIRVRGVVVQVAKRETWSRTKIRIHYVDIGNGLPLAQFGTQWLEMSSELFYKGETLEVV